MIDSHDYQVEISSTALKTGVATAADDELPVLPVASPPEFGGPAGVWSPEHLFVAALASCLMTTFRAIADRSGLEVVAYSDESVGHLQRGEDRLYAFATVTLRPRVVVGDAAMVEKAHRLLQKAETACLISRSVSSEIILEPTILVESESTVPA